MTFSSRHTRGTNAGIRFAIGESALGSIPCHRALLGREAAA